MSREMDAVSLLKPPWLPLRRMHLIPFALRGRRRPRRRASTAPWRATARAAARAAPVLEAVETAAGPAAVAAPGGR